ncbi:MAG: tRNA dihydrouridine(20/20a) synthase DusA [Gammaproteobacteria bacterium]|nr:tRNA dihydrouridine(20/20a) synthase DusA [Pseudomonadales bacterium]MCP5346276.1 tRNA dihydrouridine(20/20a) synthase DusA [Pseudomonadales bacterium]
MTRVSEHRFCVAPMMDWTDRHERNFLRLFTRRAFLYTEMLTSAALVNGDSDFLLAYAPEEQPLGIQLGGSDPVELARAASLAEQAGYREINLNIGCPSDRVQSGRFGACLMREPELVARCVAAIRDRVQIPVTVKCRIGVDDQDSDDNLSRFIEQVADAGCELFIIHARIAVLQGLTPKENREVPPLNYARVYLMKERFPHLELIINGGILSLDVGLAQLTHMDGVMVGREAYHNPYLLQQVDTLFYGQQPQEQSRVEALTRFLPYVERELAAGTALHHMTRHILGLFKGVRGGKAFRRHLSENATRSNAGIEVLLDAMSYVS